MDDLKHRLLDEFQRDFPLTPRPYAELAARLGVDEALVIDTLRTLHAQGVISRVGAVFRPNTVGASTLAAMAVPDDRLTSVAETVSAFAEVNHNYEREHAYNLWFVVTAPSAERVSAVLGEIEARTGIAVMDLPMIEDYHLDLGFELRH
ncbi:MAG: Lrp/AsnC family transcriptional regulator [Rhodospirillales bacterium]|nr:Lrp/AsnC family transcriptional regulator [Rhodospirillales bacterium]MCW8861573.1 Lrp/AsnC family transcriptional regulator [Rhodospirillales bacterium]MCW8951844.1 Lrp/AsnC family transcriptional regulator [Rhodospirillales bacterium]MCW8971074.1 Lrp/AsnC family transcriptional regulator [Rhodospirillales bacterium]MCW9001936.1 Lrp/AsnC family transcriptional regulator [Rhodospirillales bacterium]